MQGKKFIQFRGQIENFFNSLSEFIRRRILYDLNLIRKTVKRSNRKVNRKSRMAEAPCGCGNTSASEVGGFMDPLRNIFCGNQAKNDVLNTSRDNDSGRTVSDKQNGEATHIKNSKDTKDITSYSLSSADYSHPYPYRYVHGFCSCMKKKPLFFVQKYFPVYATLVRYKQQLSLRDVLRRHSRFGDNFENIPFNNS